VWWLTNDPQLSKSAADAIEDDPQNCAISAVTAYEMGLKVESGKWEAARPIYAAFQNIVDSNSFIHLPVSHEHALLASKLPSQHRDPFDRLLAAQAMVEHIDVLTIDGRIRALGARVVW
jgi:PIN domain nuclease of toxin-antitoxin system